MKLIFSPYYDQTLYTGNGECVFGIKYVGPMGLLDELELRAGLSRKYPGQMDRVMRYCVALDEYGKSCANPDDLMYWKSFNADMLNVASRMLKWRDDLVYAGLNDLTQLPEGLGVGAKELLTVLRNVEDCFNDDTSLGDRWMRGAGEKGYMSGDWQIEVRMKKELLDPIILKSLLNSGAECTFVEDVPEPQHEVRMLKFAHLTDGYQWAFTDDKGNADVYVNQDNVTLNAVFDSLGLPNVDSKTSRSFTPISQLFVCGMKLFESPVDYESLVAYLSVPNHPLNDYISLDGKCLRTLLLSHITSQGGFGYNDRSKCDWKAIIDAAKPADDTKTVVPLECCIGQWEQNYNIATIAKCCEHWAIWCLNEAAQAQSEALRQQLFALRDTFVVFPQYYSLSGSADGKPIRVLVDSLSSLASYVIDVAAKGSHEVVADMKAIAHECDKAVWMDGYDRGVFSYAYSFINDLDISRLNEAGMMIPLYDQQLMAENVAMQLAYSYVKKELVVLSPEKIESRKMYPVQIPHWKGEDKDRTDKTDWMPDGEELTLSSANTQKLEHEVSSAIFKGIDKTMANGGIRRNYESFSSLKVLIHNPFDYVLDYLMQCREPSGNNLSTVKGNVVHHMINAAVVEAECDWTKIKAALEGDFDAVFDKAVQDVGVELLMAKNGLEYNHFKEIVRGTSIPAFIEVVEKNKLNVVASETDFMVDLDEIGQYNAKIDLLLKNPDGKYVVMDFKWTDSSVTRRVDEIRENKEMQLALYSEAVRKEFCGGNAGDVEAVGYFMLKQGLFITEYARFEKSKYVKVVEKKATGPIFEMLKESYKFRMNQLLGDNGVSVIEEAEGKELKDGDLAYMGVLGLFPLEVDSKGKATNFGKNVVLKGMMI